MIESKKLKNVQLVSLYFLLMFGVIIGIGYFGIISNIKAISELRKKQADYKSQIQELNDKEQNLKKNKIILKDLSRNEQFLTKAIPEGYNYEEFVEDIINTSTGYDYEIEKIEFIEGESGTANATVTFENYADSTNTIQLIDSFIGLPRLSFLEQLEFDGKYSKKEVKANFKIYRLPK